MRLLVTGGAGFIGSNFIRYWLGSHETDRIVNYDLLTYAGDRASLADVEASAAGRYVFVRGDISDPIAVREVLRTERPDMLVNFAAESHNSRGVLDPALFIRTNVLGTQVLLDAAREAGLARFHHISTCEVYGDLALDSPERFSEESPFRPRTPYNASKAAADLVARAFHETYGLPLTISISSNNYGPFQHPEKVIPLFTANALEDQPLPVYAHSENRREWLHVDDHCRAIDLILARGRDGEMYNVGSGDERSVEQIADAVLEATGKPSTLKTHVPDRPGHDRRYLLDHSKLTRELGWEPRVDFANGLRDTVEWYRTHRGWWGPKRARAQAEVDETRWSRGAN